MLSQIVFFLFISVFLAATILPAQSEALLAYRASISPDTILQLVTVATIGNVFGTMVNWCLGIMTKKVKKKSWFTKSEHKILLGEQN